MARFDLYTINPEGLRWVYDYDTRAEAELAAASMKLTDYIVMEDDRDAD